MKALKSMIALFLIITVAGVSYAFATSQVSGNDDGSSAQVAQPQAPADDGENTGIEQADGNLSAADYLSEYSTDIDKQWALTSLQISELWQTITGGKKVVVAVLDTGIDGDHEDLAGQVIGEVNFTDSPTADDVYGHGTHIAGIIAAEDNGIGIIGVAPGYRLLNVKVADDRGRCDVSDLAEGIVWAVDNGADVINISIEIEESTLELEEAVQYAWDNGALIIAAAGNSGSQEPVYPACYDSPISVAAVTEDNRLAPLSNRGEWVDLVAPGYKIYSTFPGDTYEYESGTSFAAAHVSGIAALLFSVAADTNGDGRINDEVKAIIEAGCRDIGIAGTGEGLINAADILAQISQTT
jgi:thermitase